MYVDFFSFVRGKDGDVCWLLMDCWSFDGDDDNEMPVHCLRVSQRRNARRP